MSRVVKLTDDTVITIVPGQATPQVPYQPFDLLIYVLVSCHAIPTRSSSSSTHRLRVSSVDRGEPFSLLRCRLDSEPLGPRQQSISSLRIIFSTKNKGKVNAIFL